MRINICLVIAVVMSAHVPNVVFGAEITSPLGGDHPLEDIPSFGWVFVKMMVVLGAILLGLLVISKWILPRLMRTTPITRGGTIIEVLDVRRLEPKRTVHLVRVANKCFLIGTSEAGIQMLSGGELQSADVESALSAAGYRVESRSPRAGRPKESPSETDSGEARKGSFAAMLKRSR